MMKTKLLIFILLAGVSLSKVQAQGKASPEEKKAQKALDSRSFSALKLTDDQKTKILSILIAQNKALDSVEAVQSQGNPQTAALALKYKRLDVEKINDAKIMSLLNDDQKKSYDTYIDERTKKEFAINQPQSAPPVGSAGGVGTTTVRSSGGRGGR